MDVKLSIPGGKRALSVSESAQTLGLCERIIRELVRAGRIRAVKAGDRILIPSTAIDDFLNTPASKSGKAARDGKS